MKRNERCQVCGHKKGDEIVDTIVAIIITAFMLSGTAAFIRYLIYG